MRALRRCLDSGHCACTTLGDAITARPSEIRILITTIFQQMAVKCLEEEAPFPNLHKDTVCTSGDAAWLISRRVSKRERECLICILDRRLPGRSRC